MIGSFETLNARILIVDDQPANVALLVQMLRGAGYSRVTSTTNPLEVCSLHLANRYDLILLDIQMPGIDGFQVIEQLKEIETDGYLPVLVLTAQPDHKLRALKVGAKDFISKPFDVAEVLARVYNMAEVRLLHLETKQLYERVVAETRTAELLLLNVLPQSIAERVKGRAAIGEHGFAEAIADSYSEVTVLFAHVVEFSRFCESVSASDLVRVLNDIFSRFDRIADTRNLEKIKTIGDSYMVAAGLPIPAADHAQRAANMALDMLGAMADFNAQNPYPLSVRIGIDSGAAVAGVIGKQKFHYDLWGDVVNTASHMESYGMPGRIQITDATRRRLGASFLCEQRGPIEVKGSGEMHTWFLNGRVGAV